MSNQNPRALKCEQFVNKWSVHILALLHGRPSAKEILSDLSKLQPVTQAERDAFEKSPDLSTYLLEMKKSDDGWVSVKDALPIDGQRVLARYEGVYDARIVTFWRDMHSLHFGLPNEPDGKGSQPATHWRSVVLFIMEVRA